MDQKIAAQTEKLQKQEESFKEFEQKNLELSEELKKVKGKLAELSLQLQHKEEQIGTLKNSIQDYHNLIDGMFKESANVDESIKLRLNRLEEITRSFEERLKVTDDIKTSSPVDVEDKPSIPVSANVWEDLDEENFYNLAYQTFKNGEYNTAKEIFSAFLDKFPKGRLSDNATFWIGECYYKTNNYEQAILEYEKVKQNYPSGDKVPAAIFKQALSFLRLNVKEEAKIILRQLIQHYPESEQAKMASVELKKLE